MSRDSGSEDPSKRTVAELLAEHGGGGSQRNARRRRRRAEDPSETAPQAIIDRVVSDSGRMRPVPPEEGTDQETSQPEHRTPPPTDAVPPSGDPPADPPPPAPPATSDDSSAPAAPREATESPSSPQDANFWARRFAAAGSAPGPVQQPEQAAGARPPAPAEPDPEATAQQPALPKRPGPARPQGTALPAAPTPPRAVPEEPTTQAVPLPNTTGTGPSRHGDARSVQGAAPEVENATEQFPPVEGTIDPGVTAAANGTAMLDYSQQDEAPSVLEGDYEDPYDSLSYDPDYDDVYTADYDDLDEDDYEDDYEDDTYDPELPAGMEAEDYLDEDSEERERTPAKEWLLLAGQGGVGLLAGGMVWLGFRWLWTVIPIVALAAALAITGALVMIARRFLRTDDLQTILLAVLVGLACTVSPVALLLIGY